MADTVRDLYGQPTNTANMMQDTADSETLAAIYAQMQQGLDQSQSPQVKKGKPGRLVLTKNRRGDLNMSFDKNQVPDLQGLNVSFDQSQAPQSPRTPIGSRRGHGLRVPFDRRLQQ